MNPLSDAVRPRQGSVARTLLTEPRRPVAIRRSPRAHWYVVATVSIGAFMGQLDASIVTLALPRIGRDLHAVAGATEWVAISYLLVLVATVATIGRIADALGRKLLYVYGFGVFTAGSLLCGLAPSLPVLIAARLLQGIGAAMLQANSIALISEAVPRPQLGRALGLQGTAQALGLALGPLAGGLLLAIGGWRLIFLVNLPAGLIGLAIGWFLLPRSRHKRSIGAVDGVGALLLALAAGGLLLYLSLAGHAGYGNPFLLAALAQAVLAAGSLVRRERRVSSPLLDFSILRRRPISVGLGSATIAYLALFGTLVVVPYYLSARDIDAASIGLRLSVLPIAIGAAAPIAGRLVHRVSDRLLTSGGLALAGAGLLTVALDHETAGLLTGLALTGLGLGTFTPANNVAIMSCAPSGHSGVVSGVLNMIRGFGTALGVALAGALYVSGTGSQGLTLAMSVLGGLALATATRLVARPVGNDHRDD